MVKLTVGITGGSGVGKTTLINRIREDLSVDISVLSLDNYYRPKDQQERDENGIINFDLPNALDTERLASDVNDLRNNKAVELEQYGFNNPDAERNLIRVEPSCILIIEGLFVMHYDFIRTVLDYSVFIEAPDEIQLERRLKRDMLERNYTREDVLYQWENHVVPCYEQFLEPYKKDADLIIHNNEDFDTNFQVFLEVLHKCTDTIAQ